MDESDNKNKSSSTQHVDTVVLKTLIFVDDNTNT